MSNLKVFTRLCVSSTEIEARLSFSHKVNSSKSLWCTRNNVCLDGSSPELTLLRTTPPVWMGQYEFNFIRYRIPAVFSILVGRDKECFGGIKEITHEIREEVDYCFSPGEVCTHMALQCCRRPIRTEQKLPPMIMSDGKACAFRSPTISSGQDFRHPGALSHSQRPESRRFRRNTRSKEPWPSRRPGCPGICLQFFIFVE